MRTLHLNRNDGGLIQGTTGETLPLNFTPDACNVELGTRGLLRFPRGGYRPFLAAALKLNTPVTGIWPFFRLDGTNTLLATCGDGLFEILANKDVIQREAGLAGDRALWHASPYQGHLFLANGHNVPRVFKTTSEALAGIEDMALPEAWSNQNQPTHFNVISMGGNQHLVAWGFKDFPTRAYATAADTFLDWRTLSNAFRLQPLEGCGERLRSVFSWKDYVVLLLETQGVVYYGLDPANLDAADAKRIPFGSENHETLVYLEDDVWWICQDGPVNLKGVLTKTGVAAKYATHRIPEIVAEMGPHSLSGSHGINDRSYRRARWWLPTRRSVLNDMPLDYYYDRMVKDQDGIVQGAWMRGTGLPANCSCTYKTAGPHVVLLGGLDGMIYQANFGFQDNGADITPCYYRWPMIEPGSKVRVIEGDFTVFKGGANGRARLFFDNGQEAVMPDDLTPNVENDTVSRLTPFDYGYEAQLMVEHLGGPDPCELRAVRLRLDVARVR